MRSASLIEYKNAKKRARRNSKKQTPFPKLEREIKLLENELFLENITIERLNSLFLLYKVRNVLISRMQLSIMRIKKVTNMKCTRLKFIQHFLIHMLQCF